MLISKDFSFEASHVLPKHPGKCSRLHGHSWTGSVMVQGSINIDTGFVMDYYDLGQLIEKLIVGPLDHSHLGVGQMINEHTAYLASLDFYPSSENIVLWIAREFFKSLPSTIRLYEVRLKETCTSEARWFCNDDLYQPVERR